MTELRYSPAAARYLKRIRDRALKKKFEESLNGIANNPYAGDEKTGDLAGVWTWGFRYSKTDYRIAYTIEEVDGHLVVVIMAGTHENFYEALKKYMK